MCPFSIANCFQSPTPARISLVNVWVTWVSPGSPASWANDYHAPSQLGCLQVRGASSGLWHPLKVAKVVRDQIKRVPNLVIWY